MGEAKRGAAVRKIDAALERRRKAALACVKKLDAAADSVRELLMACRGCQDNSGDELRGISDGRHRLISDMSEYADYLAAVYAR